MGRTTVALLPLEELAKHSRMNYSVSAIAGIRKHRLRNHVPAVDPARHHLDGAASVYGSSRIKTATNIRI
jgi:hypothetical protein